MLTYLCLKELKEKQTDFLEVKKEIQKNNQISGVQSTAQLEAGRAKAQSPPSPPANSIPPASLETISKKKPEVRAKPEYLSSRPTAKDC